jgi:hypothetical protein
MMVLGSLASWADAAVPGFTAVPWKGGVISWLVLLAGAAVAGVGVGSLSGSPLGRYLTAAALGGGLAAGLLASVVAFSLDGRVAGDLASFYMRQLAMSAEEAHALVDGAIDSGQLSVTPAVGLLAAIAGSFVAVVAGLLARMWAARAALFGAAGSPNGSTT